MAITKTNKQVGGDIRFAYNESGELSGVLVPVSCEFIENGIAPPKKEGEVSRFVNIWEKYNPGEKVTTRLWVAKAKELAEQEI